MYNIKCLNKISQKGLDRFGENYRIGTGIRNPHGILLRSASMHEMEFNDELMAISRAGAGVNNIPIDRCTEGGIVVFNTPGANANAVKELVIAALLLTSRKIIPAADWIKSLKGSDDISQKIEKGKSSFAGPEINGKTLGVIGLGAIGRAVAGAASSLGMDVYGYDPFLSVDEAWGLDKSVIHSHSLDEIYSKCDYITLHLPLTENTEGIINHEAVAKMKKGARILNFARGGLVISKAIKEAIERGKLSAYATDFPTGDLIGVDNVVAIPHLGASTPESEDNCAIMAVSEMTDYLENGNITNSVNMPSITMERNGGERLCIIHRNIPNTIGSLAAACGKAGINIENMLSKSKGEYAYTILDVSTPITQKHLDTIKVLPPIIRVRHIK